MDGSILSGLRCPVTPAQRKTLLLQVSPPCRVQRASIHIASPRNISTSWELFPTQEISAGSDLWKSNIQPQPASPGLCPADKMLICIKCLQGHGQALGKRHRQLRRGSCASHSCRDFGRITNKMLTSFLTPSQNLLCWPLVRSRSLKQGPSKKQQP